MAKLKSYLVFNEVQKHPDHKTQTWNVASVHGTYLGCIKWYSPWRKYTFQPDNQTVFDTACLREIAAFITFQMESRK